METVIGSSVINLCFHEDGHNICNDDYTGSSGLEDSTYYLLPFWDTTVNIAEEMLGLLLGVYDKGNDQWMSL